MGSLFDLLGSVTDGLDLDAAIGGQAGQFLQIVEVVGKLVDNPPSDVAGYFTQLQELALPALNFGGDLGSTFGQLTPALQGGMGGLLNPITQAMQGLQGNTQAGLVGSVEPLLRAINQLKTVLNSDWSAGLVATHIPPAAPPAPPAPGDAPTLPVPPATPAIISTAQIDRAKALVDDLPADMSVKALLVWLHSRIGTARPDYFYFRAIPIVDDLRDPLDSLVRWDGLTGAQLAQEFSTTLQLVATLIEQHTTGALSAPFTAPAQAAITALPSNTLNAQATNLAAALQALQVAVAAADATAISTQLLAAQNAATALEGVNTTLDTHSTPLTTLEQSLKNLPSELETRIGRLLVLLTPRATWADLASRVSGGPLTVPGADAFAPLTELCDRVTEFIDNLLGAIDISEVMAPVINVVNQVRGGIEQLEQALVQLTSTAHAQFEQTQNAINSVGLTAVVQQAETAMDTAIQQVQQLLGQGLQPAIDGLATAVDAIDDALGAFDPEQLAQPIKAVLDGIKGVFDTPELADALAQMKKLKALAKQLDDLSFTPVANDVIKGIDTIKAALAKIDGANLSAPMPDLIAEAMSVLPDSVKPITDPLISGLGELIDQGPVPLLSELKDLPKPLFEQIRKLEPKNLLGENLSEPFNQLRDKLNDFQPEQWLDAADAELDKLRDRIRESASPKGVLQPIAGAFDQFIAQLEQFKPGDLLGPITTQIEELLSHLDGILPNFDFIQDLQALLARVQSISLVLTQAVDMARHVAEKAALLTDPATQLNQWLEEIFAKLTDASAFTAALTALQNAVTAAHAAGLQTTWESQRLALQTKLTEADARALHTQIVSRRNAITNAAVNALPASSAKTDLQTWLASFNPSAPAFARGFQQCIKLQDAVNQANQGIAITLVTWDDRYCKPDGILQNVVRPGATIEHIRDWVRQALEHQLGQPVIDFLSHLQVIGRVLTTFTDGLDAISTALQQKLTAVLAAPQGLLDIYTDFQRLLTRLSQLDLGALQQDVDALYDTLIDQARALDPRQLEQALEEKFNELLDTLSLDSLITPQVRSDINSAYGQVVKIVDTLDPQLLLVEPMQEIWEQDILPLLDAFDISETVELLISFLEPLDEQLSTEMDRVDTAYQAMLAAAPSGGGGNSGSASAGVSL